jgi:hypothetical protein
MQNPNGVWTYGWSNDLTGQLVVYPDTVYNQGGYGWTDNSIAEATDPNVGYAPVGDTEGDAPDGSMGFSPGPGNQFSHCRFTAPVAGTYTIQANFYATSYGVPHVYLLHNGVSMGDSFLNYGTPWTPTLAPVTLAAGDTIDAVIGVGTDESFYDDEVYFSLTITDAGAPVPGTFVPGAYTGLVTGTSAPGGIGGLISARVQKSGAFTGMLDLEGARLAFNGVFSGTAPYTTTLTPKGGASVNLSLGFDTGGNLAGTASQGGQTFSFSPAQVITAGQAEGVYPFAIDAVASTSTGNVPEGSGIGYIYVRPSGAVAIVGELGDGTSFSTSSAVTSGSSIPVYVNLYKSAAGELAGTLVIQDVPGVSDCAGALSWNRPASANSKSAYAQGFETGAELTADKLDPFIDSLNGESVSFDASGADLGTDFDANVTIKGRGGFIPVLQGRETGIHMTVVPIADVFFGSFLDSTTNKMRPFTGVLLPKSRTAAGLFFSGGLSGSVSLEY